MGRLMYNVHCVFDAAPQPWHPKYDNNDGYLMTVNKNVYTWIDYNLSHLYNYHKENFQSSHTDLKTR